MRKFIYMALMGLFFYAGLDSAVKLWWLSYQHIMSLGATEGEAARHVSAWMFLLVLGPWVIRDAWLASPWNGLFVPGVKARWEFFKYLIRWPS